MNNVNALWQIVLKETFFSADILVLLIAPLLISIILILVFKKSPLKSTGAWHNVGRRYMMLGCVFAGLTILAYTVCILIAYSNNNRANSTYTTRLQTSFRDYYSVKRTYTERLEDFARRIPDTKDIFAEMDNFATNLPREEREKLGRAWSGSKNGGTVIHTGGMYNDLKGILDTLYWPEERIEQYKTEHDGMAPGIAELRYTKEQIDAYNNKANPAKLYPLLDNEQWMAIKNQILPERNNRERVIAFLKDIANVFKDPTPTESLNKLYDRLAAKACPTEMQRIECYLGDSPNLFNFYKFSLQNRWWFRTIAIAILYSLIGIIVILVGNKIAKNGKKKLFK